MVLGDLNYQRMSGDLRFLRDREIEAYLNALGQKLVKYLPPSGLTFQFHIVDIPAANAFNTHGGYVFVSRKLIGFVNNEDELAGVVAHELGHATVRHSASDFSTYLKQILNVTQVGDRKDITEKYNLLIERERTKQISRSNDPISATTRSQIGSASSRWFRQATIQMPSLASSTALWKPRARPAVGSATSSAR
jgi:predicted Zn-dependent protease